MRPDDVPAVDRLRDQAGWNQTHDDWRRLLRWQPAGCFVAEEGDHVVASVSTTAYSSLTAAWIGMLLVEESKRRQGIARTMLTHAIGWLTERGAASIALDATPLGKMLYDQSGFRDVYTLQRHRLDVCNVAPPKNEGLRRFQRDDLTRVAGLDAAAFFGLDRHVVLRDIYDAYPDGCWCVENRVGNMDGYVFSRPGARAWYVGPLIARDEVIADTLLRAVLARLDGGVVIIDTLEPNPHSTALAIRYGFQPVRPFIRMIHGRSLAPARTDWYFAMAGPEIG